jgi:hypothetical protein
MNVDDEWGKGGYLEVVIFYNQFDTPTVTTESKTI